LQQYGECADVTGLVVHENGQLVEELNRTELYRHQARILAYQKGAAIIPGFSSACWPTQSGFFYSLHFGHKSAPVFWAFAKEIASILAQKMLPILVTCPRKCIHFGDPVDQTAPAPRRTRERQSLGGPQQQGQHHHHGTKGETGDHGGVRRAGPACDRGTHLRGRPCPRFWRGMDPRSELSGFQFN